MAIPSFTSPTQTYTVTPAGKDVFNVSKIDYIEERNTVKISKLDTVCYIWNIYPFFPRAKRRLRNSRFFCPQLKDISSRARDCSPQT